MKALLVLTIGVVFITSGYLFGYYIILYFMQGLSHYLFISGLAAFCWLFMLFVFIKAIKHDLI